jgi:hypothetical protein
MTRLSRNWILPTPDWQQSRSNESRAGTPACPALGTARRRTHANRTRLLLHSSQPELDRSARVDPPTCWRNREGTSAQRRLVQLPGDRQGVHRYGRRTGSDARCRSIRGRQLNRDAERAERITRLIEDRQMTVRAAVTVVDAAMFGIGCTEGTVRKQIEAKKQKKQDWCYCTRNPHKHGSAVCRYNRPKLPRNF